GSHGPPAARVTRRSGTHHVDTRMAATSRAPAHEPTGTAGARNATCVTKIISQTNSAPNSAAPKNHTYADCGHKARTTTAAARPALDTSSAGTGAPLLLTAPRRSGTNPDRASENSVRAMR